MKLSFSTLACPEYSFSDMYAMAKDLGFDGIEVRGLGNDIFDNRHNMPFASENIRETARMLKSIGLEVSILSSDCCLRYSELFDENIKIVSEYIQAAKALGTKYVRVLGDDGPAPTDGGNDEEVIRQLLAIAPIAEEAGVTVLIETNGVYSDTARLKSLLDNIHSDNVAVLWDIHHPYRFMHESPETTVQNLGMYIAHVHIKDSIEENGEILYKLMGEGDMPIEEMINALRSINFEGYLSLEWVKRWAPYLQDAGIIFPNYINYMSAYTGRISGSDTLIDDLRGKGKYIWQKNMLIDLTFPQVLDRVCEAFPDQYAFRFTECDYTRTYPQFRDDVDRFARALISLGVKRGDHVAVWSTNLPQWYIAFWATTKIGAVLVTANTAYKIYEIEYLLRQSDTHTLIMCDGYKDSDYNAIIHELCPELNEHIAGKPLYTRRLPFLRNVITLQSEQKGCLTWESALEYAENTPIEEVYRRASLISKHDVCNMQYTSGTTGFPKGVMLTHYNVVNNGKNIGDGMDLSSADRMMIQVPMFHCFGMVLAMTASVTHGVTMSPLSYFSPKRALDCINKEKITCFHGVPTMFIALLENEKFKDTDFSYMRTGIMAGSPCPVKVMQDVVDKMNMKEITIVYGQTEASPGCTMSLTTDSLEARVNTVGGAMFGVECKIVDPETGEELPNNVDGEFVARGYNIMKGYYKMPQATALAIDENGWLHTGDLARKTDEGYFKITGRIKDMIIRGGENIYPKEIEDFIYTHEKVKDVQVIGVPDVQYGEEIMAWIVPKEGETITEDEIKTYVKEHMAKHKTPKYVKFVSEFPMNAAGKILKYKMREMSVEELNLKKAASIETA
ncbi:MAG: AMP-binding protein [Clostridia bacterium]|nr:AMP-binding protein [Clostridia bacterium]